MTVPQRTVDRDERGVILILAAMTTTVMLLAGSLAVDLGGRAYQKRADHLVADMAALDAVRGVSGNAAAVTTLANQSASRNLLNGTVTATRGHYDWSTGAFTAASPYDSVQTTASSTYHDFFHTNPVPNISASAIATVENQANFLIGSTLVDVNAGLGKWGSVSLSAVGYNGLASGNVTLGEYATALGLNTSVLTPSQVLASSFKVSQLASGAATLLSASNDAASVSLTTLAGQLSLLADNSNQVTLGSLLNLSTGNGAAFSSDVNLLQAITGGVELANQKAGLMANLGISLGLLGSASFSVTAIVPPSVAPMGPPSPDLGFATESNTQVSGTLAITLLTVGLLNVTLSVGKATGTLTQADCNDGSPEDIHVGTTFQNVVLTVTSAAGVSGTITLPSNPVADKTLNYPTNFAPAPPGTVVTASSSLGAPTFSGNAAFMLLQAVLSPLLSTLLTGPVGVDALLSGLGVTVGNADYLGLGMTCGVPKLVQ